MALAPLLAFTRSNVELVPHVQGIYCLYADARLVYIGSTSLESTSLRTRLLRHLDGLAESGTEQATHFAIEVTDEPVEKRWLLLNAYFRNHGAAPPFNTLPSG